MREGLPSPRPGPWGTQTIPRTAADMPPSTHAAEQRARRGPSQAVFLALLALLLLLLFVPTTGGEAVALRGDVRNGAKGAGGLAFEFPSRYGGIEGVHDRLAGVRLGDVRRLGHAIAKARRKRPLHVVAYGTSITGRGGCLHRDTPCRRADVLDAGDAGEGQFERNGWFALLARYLAETYPDADHTFENVGKHAGGPGTSVMCSRNHFFRKPIDILIVEYACMQNVNEQLRSLGGRPDVLTEYQQGMERVLRKFLHRSSARHPCAIIMLHTFHWCRNRENCRDPLTGETFQLGYENLNGTFVQGGDDGFDTLARYYGQSSVSTRDAIYHLAASGASGFRLADFINEGDMGVHHNDRGHRIIADLLVTLLQLVDNLVAAAPHSDLGKASFGQLPPPLEPGNFAGRIMSCAEFEAEDTAKTSLQAGDGWAWSGSEPGAAGSEKAGLATTSPGAWFEVLLDTVPMDGVHGLRDAASESQSKRETMQRVTVLYISSYETFGIADVECVAGCTCDAQRLNAHVARRTDGSPIQEASFEVSAARECRLRTTLSNDTDSGGHRFKVLEVRAEWSPKEGWAAHGGMPRW